MFFFSAFYDKNIWATFFFCVFFCFVYNLIICYILNTWGQIMMMSYAIHIYQCVQPYTNTFAIFWKCRILIFLFFFLYTLNERKAKISKYYITSLKSFFCILYKISSWFITVIQLNAINWNQQKFQHLKFKAEQQVKKNKIK